MQRSSKEIRHAFAIMDAWFDARGRQDKSIEVLHQIKGAHAMLAWILRIRIPGSHDFDANLKALEEEIREVAQ